MRITGGRFRSRTLVAPRGQETRPTSDRVREALFSILASLGVFDEHDATLDFVGPRVLDLYAGSGALGLEAVSRGAREAVLVESAPPALRAIKENVGALDVGDVVTIIPKRVERAIAELEGPFEVVFLDPPYADVRQPAFRSILDRTAQLMTSSGTVVLEHSSKDEPAPPSGLTLSRRRVYGDTALSFFFASES